MIGGRADEGIGVVAKEVGVGVGDAGEFPAGHRMACEEEFGGVVGKKSGGFFCDTDFGAAGVGDESVGRGETSDFRQEIESHADGESDVDKIGVFEGGSEIGGEGGVDGVARLRFADDLGAIPAGEMDVGGVFAKGEGEGAAD